MTTNGQVAEAGWVAAHAMYRPLMAELQIWLSEMQHGADQHGECQSCGGTPHESRCPFAATLREYDALSALLTG